jgi:putative endonuclease
MANARRTLGELGEQHAAEHLQRSGAQILARAVRTAAGELDLVALNGGMILFVEVKTRRVSASLDRGSPRPDPLAGIGVRKRLRVRRAGAAWLSENPRRPTARAIRFDAIGVTIDAAGRVRALEHVRDAF